MERVSDDRLLPQIERYLSWVPIHDDARTQICLRLNDEDWSVGLCHCLNRCLLCPNAVHLAMIRAPPHPPPATKAERTRRKTCRHEGVRAQLAGHIHARIGALKEALHAVLGWTISRTAAGAFELEEWRRAGPAWRATLAEAPEALRLAYNLAGDLWVARELEQAPIPADLEGAEVAARDEMVALATGRTVVGYLGNPLVDPAPAAPPAPAPAGDEFLG